MKAYRVDAARMQARRLRLAPPDAAAAEVIHREIARALAIELESSTLDAVDYLEGQGWVRAHARLLMEYKGSRPDRGPALPQWVPLALRL